MNSQTHTSTGTVTRSGRPPIGVSDRCVRHAHDEFAAARRRERAQQRNAQAGERRELLAQLARGRGVTDTLAAAAQPQDTPHDHVRRARLLRDILHEVQGGTVTVDGLSARKTGRFLAFLEREIAWLENLATGRR
jgi:hypothetical protein